MSVPASLKPTSTEPSTELRVGGFVPLSTCDWPGELVATVFCQGCAWDCVYCQNQHLRPMQAEPQRTWREILRFLESRKGLLDAVVFSGGEPTLQPALFDAVQNVRELGFRVGLHTAGMAMKRFAALLPWIDWVGFDVKASFDVYSRITGAEQSGDQALASLRLLLASKVAYEVRTTVHPALLTSEDLLELQAALLSLGVTHYTIQHARTPAQQAQRLPSLFETSRLILPSGYGDKFARFSER